MIKEFFKKHVLVSAAALVLMAIGGNAKADFFRWYLADDVAHNGDGRTMCFQIDAYDHVMNLGNPVPEINCGLQPGAYRLDLADYRLVRDVFGFNRCYQYNAGGVMLNHGHFVEERMCFENTRLERERYLREWRIVAERERVIRMREHDRLERERIAREERERIERERMEREHREHRRASNDDANVEDTNGIKSVAPSTQELAPGSQDTASKEIAG